MILQGNSTFQSPACRYMSHGQLMARVAGFVLGTSNIETSGSGGHIAVGVDTNEDGGPDYLSLSEENTGANIIDSGIVVANGHYLIAYTFSSLEDYPASPLSFDIKRVPTPSLALVPPADPSSVIRVNFSNASPDAIPGSNGQIYIPGKDQFQLSIDVVEGGPVSNVVINWIEGQIPDCSSLPFLSSDASGFNIESNEDLLLRGIDRLDFSLQVLHTYTDGVWIPAATPSMLSFLPNTTDAVDDTFSAVAIYAGNPAGSELDVLSNDNDLDGDLQQVVEVDGQAILGDGPGYAITTASGLAVWRNVSGTLQASAPAEQANGQYAFAYTIQDDGLPPVGDTATISISVITPDALIASAIHTGTAYRIDPAGSTGPYIQLAIDTDGDATFDLFSAIVPISTPYIEISAAFTSGSIAKLSVFSDAAGSVLLAEAEKAYPGNTVVIGEAGVSDPISWTFSDNSSPSTYDPGYLPASDQYIINMHIVGGAYEATYNLYVDPSFAAIDVAILPPALQAIFSNVGDTIYASSLLDLLNAEISEIQVQVNIIHHYADGSVVNIETMDVYEPDPSRLYEDADLTFLDIVESNQSGTLTEFKISWDKFGIAPFNGSAMLAAIPVMDVYERPSNGDPDILIALNQPLAIASDTGTGTVTITRTGGIGRRNTSVAGNELIYRLRELSLAKSAGDPCVVATDVEFRVNQYAIAQAYLIGQSGNTIQMSKNSSGGPLASHPDYTNYVDVNLYKGDESGTLLYHSTSALGPNTTYPSPYNAIVRQDFIIAYMGLKSWMHGYKQSNEVDVILVNLDGRVGNTFSAHLQTKTVTGGLNVTGNVDYYVINEDTAEVITSGFFTAAQINSPADSYEERTDLAFSFTAPIGAKITVGLTAVRSDYGGPETVHMGGELQLLVF